MLTNYLLVAIRNLRRNKVTALINISGLAIALACCMLIILYTRDELSYDRFHEQGHRLQRIVARVIDDKGNQLFKTVKTGMVVGPAFKQEIPGISDYTRIANAGRVVRAAGQVFNQDLLFVDTNFFSLFSFPLLSGNAAAPCRPNNGQKSSVSARSSVPPYPVSSVSPPAAS
ncbi:ABC transporter permease [Puia sp.]|uniref:ABC transporter permease n=1 Tax=Puia sp. TaxID=2045100 RepID=UPI002F408D33